MTIRIYPSRLSGEPLETHEHDETTVHKWLSDTVDGYAEDMRHPIAVELNGINIPSTEWVACCIEPSDDVCIYPIPYAAAYVAWAAVAIAVASAAYAIFMTSNMDSGGYSSGTGDSLDLSPSKANSAKLGDPIRELFGRYKIYPDYVVQPVSRFSKDDPTRFTTNMFVCLGVGTFSFSDGDIRVGATPVTSLDDGFSYTVYPPGANVAGDERTENWFNSTEVGGTSSGSGLDMGPTSPDEDDVLADSVTVSGSSVSFAGLRKGDDGAPTDTLPESWVVGATVELIIPDAFAITHSGAYSVITSNTVEEINPYVGMPVTLSIDGTEYNLFIASYTPSSSIFGTKASVMLAYDSATGAAFGGIPDGAQRLALGHRGNEYKISAIDGTTITVQRLINGIVDNTWPGFVNRTVLDFEANGINDNKSWLGPFLACPSNETTNCFEVNFSFPNGICGYNKKGKKRNRTVVIEVQYRIYGSGSGWISRIFAYNHRNINALGFTERITLNTSGLVEVRARRTNEQGSDNARDNAYWQALRSRLPSRPAAYDGVTTMAVSVVTGGKIAAQSDRRINVVATKNYETGAARSISGALYYVLTSLGFKPSQIDSAAINALESAYWTPNREYFDWVTGDSTSSLEVLQKIANAGKGYFLLSDGLASVGREGVKNWTGIISPQETTEPLQTSFSVPSEDDYDGVDVTYINGTTWAEETVQCRTPDNPTPVKIESYTLDGVTDADIAYQIGMRRLMKYRYQRLSFSTTTELDALCYDYMDRIVLTDDIPGHKTISCLITGMVTTEGKTTFTVSEPLDWSFANPRALIRYQDGSASGLLVAEKAGEYQVSVPYSTEFGDIMLDDPYIEPPRLIFCDSSRVGYDAIMFNISPNPDGTCPITAKEYNPIFYSYDNAKYPGNIA